MLLDGKPLVKYAAQKTGSNHTSVPLHVIRSRRLRLRIGVVPVRSVVIRVYCRVRDVLVRR